VKEEETKKRALFKRSISAEMTLNQSSLLSLLVAEEASNET
jgi:hypothetical protein